MIEGTAGTAEDRDVGGTAAHVGWKLEDFAQQPQIKKAGLLLAELAGLRSYTRAPPRYICYIRPPLPFTRTPIAPHRGPMYVHYNRTLRDRTKGAYVTTMHAINSGIIKLSKQTISPAPYTAAWRAACCPISFGRPTSTA